MTRYIALDGPLNGDYIDATLAELNHYELTEWTEGELAYLHVPTSVTETDENGVPLEIAREIAAAEAESDV